MATMNFLKNWSIQFQNKFKVDGVEKTIERVTGTVYQEGSDVDATVINEIQKHNVYKCDATRVIEGVNEIYDVAISGSDSFPVFDALIVVNFNETNTKDNPLLRLNNLNYSIRKASEFSDIVFSIGTLKGKYFGYIDIASSKFIVFDNINVSLLAKLESPTFTGTPTAPTSVAGATGEQLANLDFVNSMLGGNNVPAKDLSANGYAKMANGLIMQWGSHASNTTITFPVAFPTACLQVISTANATDPWGLSLVSGKSNTSFTIARSRANGTIWFAIGY